MPETTIAFLGQCHAAGYPGVPPELTFPHVCRRAVQERRPGSTIRVVVEQYLHPAELPRATERALRARPHVVVLEVVGWLAVKGKSAVDLSKLPRGVRTTYERARHFRQISQLVAAKLPETSKLIHRVQVGAVALANNVLGSLMPRYPRPTIADYETLVDDAIVRMQQESPGISIVVQGPGAPNLALESRRLTTEMPTLYREVEQMARRIAAARGVLYVDRWSTVSTGFYLPRSVRPHADGHTTWGQLLAEELVAAGVV